MVSVFSETIFLLEIGKFYFLSRTKRFGKSLAILTFYYLFKGEKELFKGTYIYDKATFTEVRFFIIKDK